VFSTGKQKKNPLTIISGWGIFSPKNKLKKKIIL
jgi:hypothetical protein